MYTFVLGGSQRSKQAFPSSQEDEQMFLKILTHLDGMVKVYILLYTVEHLFL